MDFQYNYILNPSVKYWLELGGPGSEEKEVQGLVENVVWTVFTAAEGFTNVTKYKRGATEPDQKTMKLIQFIGGWAPVDLLMGELKREQEDKSGKAFDRVARDNLDDHLEESTNPNNTTLFGFVGIGDSVKFYKKLLPKGPLVQLHSNPLHWEFDAPSIQEKFEYFKVNIPTVGAASYDTAQSASAAPAYMALSATGVVPTSYVQTGGTGYAHGQGYTVPIGNFASGSGGYTGSQPYYASTGTYTDSASVSNRTAQDTAGTADIGPWSDWVWYENDKRSARTRANPAVPGGWEYDYDYPPAETPAKSSSSKDKSGKGKGRRR